MPAAKQAALAAELASERVVALDVRHAAFRNFR
jgi:hypothetical protein